MTMNATDTGNPIIFVLEDEPDIARLICSSLAEYGFRCEHLRTGRDLLVRARSTTPDLCIVDLGLPDMDGMQVVRQLQEGTPCAVLILTGRNDVTDRVLGLELGADDYIVKPFEPRASWSPACAPSCAATSVRRRLGRSPSATSPASPAGSSMATATPSPPPDGREIGLSAAEAGLLATLLRRPNKILSREQLLGERDVDPFDRSIDVRISRLRRKLDDDPQNPRLIKTVYGAGYLFAAQVSWQ